jgi:hypothetical protein
MTRIKRPAVALGAAALLALSLTACGGGGGGSAPDDASAGDFCKDFGDAFNQDFGTDPTEDQFNSFKDQVANLGDTGTPKGIPDDARNGFETFVDAVDKLDYNDVKNAGPDETFGISKDDKKDFEAFFAYATTTCAEELGAPSDIPTEDIPTELSDLPTDLTDIPTDLSSFLSDLPTDLSDLSDLTEIPTS